jgi:hypothetical protein
MTTISSLKLLHPAPLQVGGRAQSLWAGPDSAFRFDTGPSLLLFPDKYREVRYTSQAPASCSGCEVAPVHGSACMHHITLVRHLLSACMPQ